MKTTVQIIFFLLILITVVYFIFQIIQDEPEFVITDIYPSNNQSTSLEIETTPDINTLAEPIAEFQNRITKKPFGIYITPGTSPVQPEKFSGYHTAVDIEYDDVLDDVPVIAIADGEVMAAKTVSGYGRVVVIKHLINEETILAIYGHLDNNRSVAQGGTIKQGDTIGYLGKDKTAETDFERRHLHFGMIKGAQINYQGYVSNEEELTAWYDPLIFY